MNYDTIFTDNINYDFFFNKKGYPQRILMNGFISLENAEKRLPRGEFYSLVTYDGQQQLPEEYIPIGVDTIDGMEDDKQFATIRPDLELDGISMDGGIQALSILPSPAGNAVYCLNPDSSTILLSDLVQEQVEAYKNKNRKIR